MPLHQQILSQNRQAGWVEEVSEGYLKLLDICGTSRDALIQSKENLQDIHSILRRRCSGKLDITNEAEKYFKTRKTAKKTIKKCLKCINEADQNRSSNAIENMLKDVETITIDILKSLLSHIAGIKLQSQKTRWSVLSKFMNQSAVKAAAASSSAFVVVDATLDSMICQKKNAADMSKVEDIRSQMVNLESEIQDLDEVIEYLFRNLIKTRATLLNILSN